MHMQTLHTHAYSLTHACIQTLLFFLFFVCVLTQIHGGLAALYKGTTPVMLRAIPANAVRSIQYKVHACYTLVNANLMDDKK